MLLFALTPRMVRNRSHYSTPCGGSNDIENLQPLCKDCHKQKTADEITLGVYKDDEEISYFNQIVLNNVVQKNEFKTWAFVEQCGPEPENTNLLNLIARKAAEITYIMVSMSSLYFQSWILLNRFQELFNVVASLLKPIIYFRFVEMDGIYSR